MRPELSAVVEPLLVGVPLPEGALRAAMSVLMSGGCGEAETAALLTALAVRGETSQDLAESAAILRERATPVRTRRQGLLDTCGTGGDGLHTFNISTAAAIVAAAAGAAVAKHGNRQASSRSGSADVLEALGVHVELTADVVGQCLDDIGLGFCFARLLHTAMKHVAPVRAALGFRTIFNLLGPLANPAAAEFQLLGASRLATARRLAEAAARLGTRRTLVVCGNDQLDEVALWGETRVFDVHEGTVAEHSWTAADFGLHNCRVEELRAESPEQSAAIIGRVLDGQRGAARDIVVANAAAGLYCTGAAGTVQEAARLVDDVIASGAARAKLEELIAWTRRAAAAAPPPGP